MGVLSFYFFRFQFCPEHVRGLRECAGAHVVGVIFHGAFEFAGEVAVAFDEFGHVVGEETGHVFGYEDLAVAGGGGTDADGGDVDGLGDFGGDRFGDTLQYHGGTRRRWSRLVRR